MCTHSIDDLLPHAYYTMQLLGIWSSVHNNMKIDYDNIIHAHVHTIEKLGVVLHGGEAIVIVPSQSYMHTHNICT